MDSVRAQGVAQGVSVAGKLAPLLRAFLIERYGLPERIDMDDFKVKPVNQ